MPPADSFVTMNAMRIALERESPRRPRGPLIKVRTDTPICHSPDGTAEKAICIRCVECSNSSQCLCGACDIAAGTCTQACHNSADCMGNQCCIRTTGKCQPGRCSSTAGRVLCGCAMAGPRGASSNTAALLPAGAKGLASLGGPAALLAVALCALGLRRRLPRAAA